MVMAAVIASPGRPARVITSALAPTSAASAQGWNGRNHAVLDRPADLVPAFPAYQARAARDLTVHLTILPVPSAPPALRAGGRAAYCRPAPGSRRRQAPGGSPARLPAGLAEPPPGNLGYGVQVALAPLWPGGSLAAGQRHRQRGPREQGGERV